MTTATCNQVETDDKLTLAQAMPGVPGKPSVSCGWRWCRYGIKARTGQRIKLRHIRVGARVFTSRKWLDQFFAELAQADADYFDRPEPAPAPFQPPTSSVRLRATQAAEAKLMAAGA